MARVPTKVLAFPVAAPDPQLSLGIPDPLHDPTTGEFQCKLLREWEILVLCWQHDMLRLQRLGPSMTGREVFEMQMLRQADLVFLDKIEAAVRQRITAQAKAIGLIA